jgi:hypothetical protein
MYIILYIYLTMKKTLQKDWAKEIRRLWPCLKGSLAKVYKPCIRKNCPACLRGDKHPNWLLAYTQNGKRRCAYVPLEMVETIRRALNNGRRLEKILYRMGPLLIKTRSKAPLKS